MKRPDTPVDELHRQAMLRSTNMLDSAPEERFDRITRIARRLFGVPIALVSLVDSDRQWFKSKQGIDASETPREISFCGHAILGDEPLIVENAQRDARFSDNPLVTQAPGIRFYAGHPLAAADGSKLGTLCIISNEPRTLSPDDKGVLHALATMVESELGAPDLSTTDAITGLANLRGFLDVGDYVLRLARRLHHPLRVLLLRIEPARAPDHTEDSAPDEQHLVASTAAELLRSFPEADLLGRLGPRDFAVLLSHSTDNGLGDEPILQRLIQRLGDGGASAGLNAVWHSVAYDLQRHASLEDVVSEAEGFLTRHRQRAEAI